MDRYRAPLSEAVHDAPKPAAPLEVVRHTVRQVASVAAAQPRVREIVQIAAHSVAAREAQFSRRADVGDAVIRVWSKRNCAEILDIADDVFDSLTMLVRGA